MPSTRESGGIARLLERFDEPPNVCARRLDLARTARQTKSEQITDEGSSSADAGITRGVCSRSRFAQDGLRLVEEALFDRRLGKLGKQLEPLMRLEGEHRCRPPEQARCRRGVTSDKGASACTTQLLGSTIADASCVFVDDAEIRAVLVRLLEVITVDLFELELAPTLLVDTLGPGHEPLVKHGPGALQQAPVCRVADDLVAESVEHLRVRELADELLRDEDIEVLPERGHDGFVDELRDRVEGKREADDRGWVDDRALLGLKRIEPGGDEGVDGRGDLQLVRALSSDPAFRPALDRFGLDKHRHDLFDVERVALGDRRDS